MWFLIINMIVIVWDADTAKNFGYMAWLWMNYEHGNKEKNSNLFSFDDFKVRTGWEKKMPVPCMCFGYIMLDIEWCMDI